MKKYKRFFEDTLPDWVLDELKRYVRDAGKRLNTSILDKVEQFKPDNPITIYRGMGFDIADASDILKKFKIKDPKIGVSCIYKTGKIQSWSLSKDIAKDFAGKFIFGRMRDLNSLGIVLEIRNIKPEEIAVPIAFLNKQLEKPLPFSEQEEILINPGSYKATVVEFIGDWANSSSVNLKPVIKELSLRAQKEVGGVLGKTWNKEPGFALHFPEIFIENKWSPGLEIHVDGLKVYLEVFDAIQKLSNSQKNKYQNLKEKAEKEFSNIVEVDNYLQSDELFNYIVEAYTLIKNRIKGIK